jgi:hypothetical protein
MRLPTWSMELRDSWLGLHSNVWSHKCPPGVMLLQPTDPNQVFFLQQCLGLGVSECNVLFYDGVQLVSRMTRT